MIPSFAVASQGKKLMNDPNSTTTTLFLPSSTKSFSIFFSKCIAANSSVDVVTEFIDGLVETYPGLQYLDSFPQDIIQFDMAISSSTELEELYCLINSNVKLNFKCPVNNLKFLPEVQGSSQLTGRRDRQDHASCTQIPMPQSYGPARGPTLNRISGSGYKPRRPTLLLSKKGFRPSNIDGVRRATLLNFPATVLSSAKSPTIPGSNCTEYTTHGVNSSTSVSTSELRLLPAMLRRHRFTPSKRKEEPIKHREVPSSLYGWVTLQLTRDPTFARGFLSARSVTGFLSDVYSVAADEVGKIFVIADERADLSKPETIPATLVVIHTVIDCATGRPEEPIKTRMSSSDFESPKKTSKNTQSPSSTRGVKRKCIGETSKWNKVPQYMISQTKRFGTKVQPFNDLSVISDLNTTFTNKQKELFKATPFGHVFKFPKDLKFQAQSVHHIILREVYSMSEDVEFWFKINGAMVRFSIEEFSLITGLKCHGNDDDSIFVEKDESLKKVLFKESKGLITKKEVRNAFIRKRAKGDVNMVKLGLVHFLANFLFGTVPETKVSNFFWNIVDSDDATFQQFPYGKLLWEKSRHSMRLSLMKKEEIFEKMFDEETGKIFETIPALSPTFCEKREVVQLLPKESEKECEILKEFSFQPKFMFREAPQTDVQPLTEILILRPSTSVPKAKEKSPVMETKNYNAEFKKLDKRMKDILSNQKNIHGELVIFNQNFKDFCKILSEYTRSTPSGTSNVDKCVLENDVPLTKKDKIEHSLSGHEVVPGNVHADDGYVDPQNEELEGKKLMGALVIEDHDCTDEVVDAAYSGFSAAMKFIQKSKGEGAQITKNEEPHTPFVVVSPDLKSTTEKGQIVY
ncbi:hypothetical protein G4B88_012549 [Cannabis sativa]|uniref:DUF1985 domain-containing protein n=1 Tax=Cannabis sativa TaxID=3483 RepID=A0A7J6EPN3_CANSA|nr:hypothetical protein G4B88_012549 [Cannabis sativa]